MSSLFKTYVDGIAKLNPDSQYRTMADETDLPFITYNYDISKPTPTIHSVKHFQEYVEMIYVIKGTITAIVNNSTFNVSSGDLLIILPGDVHTIDATNSQFVIVEAEPEFLFTTLVSSIDLQYVVPAELSSRVGTRHVKAEYLDTTDIPQLIYETVLEYENKRPYYRLAIRTNCSKVVLTVLRHWEETNLLIRTDIRPTEKPSFPKLAIVIEKINTEYNTNLTATDMAELAGMSYSYFSRTFKQMVGENFSEYLNIVRINESKKLLSETDIPISEIADMVGFSNTSYFISQFKKIANQTPKKYRDGSKKNI